MAPTWIASCPGTGPRDRARPDAEGSALPDRRGESAPCFGTGHAAPPRRGQGGSSLQASARRSTKTTGAPGRLLRRLEPPPPLPELSYPVAPRGSIRYEPAQLAGGRWRGRYWAEYHPAEGGGVYRRSELVQREPRPTTTFTVSKTDQSRLQEQLHHIGGVSMPPGPYESWRVKLSHEGSQAGG